MTRLLLLIVLVFPCDSLAPRAAEAQSEPEVASGDEKPPVTEEKRDINPFAPRPPVLLVQAFEGNSFRGRLEGFDGEYLIFHDLDSSKNTRVHLYDLKAQTIFDARRLAERSRMVIPDSIRQLDDFRNYWIDGRVVIGRHFQTKENGEVGVVVFATVRDGIIEAKKTPELTWFQQSQFTDEEDRKHLEGVSYGNVKTRGIFVKPPEAFDIRSRVTSDDSSKKQPPPADFAFECLSCHKKFNARKTKCPGCGVVFGFIEDEFGNRTRLDTGVPWRSLIFFVFCIVSALVRWIQNKSSES